MKFSVSEYVRWELVDYLLSIRHLCEHDLRDAARSPQLASERRALPLGGAL